MRRLYLICGAPFSGKTTLAQKLTSKTQSHYVSMDDIMRQRGFDLSQLQPVEEWARAHQICVQRIDTLMREGVSIVLDDTNYLKGLRDIFRALASQHHYDITTIYLHISLPELEKRRKNAFRTGERNALPDEAFYPIIEQFEPPDESEHPLIYDETLNMNEWIEQNIMQNLV
jgi:predicted kinase